MPPAPRVARATDRVLRTDLALLLALRGYEGMAAAWREHPEDTVLPVRFLGRPAVLVRGEGGARTFYDTDRFARTGAVPAVVAHPLFGRGAVHGLDGDAHRFRKTALLQVLDHSSVAELAQRTSTEWRRTVQSWEADSQHDVFEAAVTAIGRGALDWSGSTVRPDDIDAWSRDLAGIVEGFGSLGPRHALRRRLARRRSEVWARRSILAARAVDPGSVAGPTPVQQVAEVRDDRGRRLDVRTAGVELLNLVRPTVAVSWFVAFAAQALAEHPDLRRRLATATGTDADRVALAHELRRLCPFVPALAARAREDVDLGPGGPTLHRGERLVLDVYDTDHLPSRYPRPGVLDPDRFLDRPPGPFDLVPQGGGDPAHGHRCPGEPVTVLLLADAVRTLADLDAELDGPAGYGLRRMPTRPRGGPRLRVRTRLAPGTGPDPDQASPTGVAVTTLPEETVPPPQPDPHAAPRPDRHTDRRPDPRRAGAPGDEEVVDAVAADRRRVLDALDLLQRDPSPTDPLGPALWLLAVHDAVHHEVFPLVAGDRTARRVVAASLEECSILQQQTEQLRTTSPPDGVDLVQAGLLAETAESHFRAQRDVELPALLPHLDAAARTVLVEALTQVPPRTTGADTYGALSASARARVRATWVRPSPRSR